MTRDGEDDSDDLSASNAAATTTATATASIPAWLTGESECEERKLKEIAGVLDEIFGDDDLQSLRSEESDSSSHDSTVAPDASPTAAAAQAVRPILIMDLDETIVHAATEGAPKPSALKNPNATQVAAADEEGGGEPPSAQPPTIVHAPVGPAERDPLGPWMCGTPSFFLLDLSLEVTVRPGMRKLLRHAAKEFDLCVCSMGCREYVLSVVSALDPDGSLFGNRVLSREMFPDGVKRVPVEWRESGAGVVAVDDRPGAWEPGTEVVTVEPFYQIPLGQREKQAQRDRVRELRDALDLYLCMIEGGRSRKRRPAAAAAEEEDEEGGGDQPPRARRRRTETDGERGGEVAKVGDIT